MKKDCIDNAKFFARKGLKLFPARFIDGNHLGLVKWSRQSTNDIKIIEQWGKQFKDDAYFCVALQQSGLTVVDVDLKNNKEGYKSLDVWEKENGKLPKSLTAKTPNKGVHIFYEGLAKTGANRLGKGVDIPVMVPLPGSIVPGKGNYEIETLRPIAKLPKSISNGYAKSENKPSSSKAIIEEDQPHNIKAAKDYFSKVAEPAIEGSGGDATTYQVICGAFEAYALSRETCIRLGLKYYNPRCEPPWNYADFHKKVDNALRYKQRESGASNIDVDFQPILKGFTKVGDMKVKPANWLVKGLIEMDTHTLWYGQSGVFKSFMALDLGLHIASGRKWLGLKTKRGPVLYVCGEGRGGISRRVTAWRKYHNISDREWQAVPFFGSDQPYPLLSSDKAVENLKEWVVAYKPVLVIIDTLSVAFSGRDENSVQDMTEYLGQISKLRQISGSTALSIHHTGHTAQDRPRGSYSLMAGVDSYAKIEKPASMYTILKSAGKMKDGMPLGDVYFKCEVVKIGVDEDLKDITSLTLKQIGNSEGEKAIVEKGLNVNERIVMDILANGKIDRIKLREEFKRMVEMENRPYDRRYLLAALKNLEKKELVVVSKKSIKPVAVKKDNDESVEYEADL